MNEIKRYLVYHARDIGSLSFYLILLIIIGCTDVASSQSNAIGNIDTSEENNRTLTLRNFLKGRYNRNCIPKSQYRLPKRFPFTGKKGIGLTLRTPSQPGSYIENFPKVLALDVAWNYAWSINRITQQPNVPVFVPMIWSGGKSASSLKAYIDGSNLRSMIQQGKVTHVLGFNEPDEWNQSNMTVNEAINRWPVLQSLGVPLVSPSCLQPGSQWMIDFMAKAVKKCLRVDYLGIHWYGPPSINSFKAKMISYWNLHKMPLVITEFALADWNATTKENNTISPSDVLEFMKGILPWLEQRQWVYGYSWYPFKYDDPNGWSSALFFTNGTLTAVGRYYKSVRHFRPNGNLNIKPDPTPF